MNVMVDPPELHNAAATFRSLSEEYKTVYDRLLNCARTMGEAWNAADNLAYVDQINGFCEELQAMQTHIEQAATALDQQAKNYEDTRDTNITSVRQLQN